jgi:hypothetical protein
LRPALEAAAVTNVKSSSPYIFIFTLFLPEGRAGIAWELYIKLMLFLPPPPHYYHYSLVLQFPVPLSPYLFFFLVMEEE